MISWSQNSLWSKVLGQSCFKEKIQIIFYPLIFTYVKGTQKNCLTDMTLLSNHNIFLVEEYENKLLIANFSTTFFNFKQAFILFTMHIKKHFSLLIFSILLKHICYEETILQS